MSTRPKRTSTTGQSLCVSSMRVCVATGVALTHCSLFAWLRAACGVRATVVAAAVHGAQQEAQPGYVRMLVWLTRTHMELCRSHDWLGNAVLFLSFALARDHVRQAKSRGFLRGYTKSDKLGSGGFGVVWSATGIDGISVAVKQASKGCSREWALMRVCVCV